MLREESYGIAVACPQAEPSVSNIPSSPVIPIRIIAVRRFCMKLLRDGLYLPPFPAAQSGSAPTVSQAEEFMKQAETRLADLYVKVNHATWVQENWAEKYFERERDIHPATSTAGMDARFGRGNLRSLTLEVLRQRCSEFPPMAGIHL